MITKKLSLSAFVLGICSMVGQIIILRELIVIFYGNELSLGVILAMWLFWVSVGSGIIGRLVDRVPHKEKLLSNIQLATSLLLPLNIFFIRNIKSMLKISSGEIIGLIHMAGSSFLSLSFIGILLGFTFTLISKIAAEKSKSPSQEIGRIYLLEGIGASIGGLIYSFFLIKAFSPFQNILFVGGLNLIISVLFNKNILQLIYLIILSATFILNLPQHLEKYTRTLQFKGLRLVKSIDSIYGNLTVTKMGKEYSFYENGLHIFTTGDLLTSEESVHYALLEHPHPETVLLIGGGISGSIEEILKHSVKDIDYVELDPLIIDLAKKYTGFVQDKRVNIINTDGRRFVNTMSLIKRKTYDVIILNLPDPYTALVNRFYSAEFFGKVQELLTKGGIFSFTLTSSENYINPEGAYYLSSIYNTLKSTKKFPDIKILPGDTAIFLASNSPGILTYNVDILIKRLNERHLQTKFVREYYLPFKLNPLRIKYIEDSIKEFPDAKVNLDFRPVGYLYHTSLWMTLFHSGKGILPYIKKIDLRILILIIASLSLLIFLIKKLTKASFKLPVVISIGTTGMSEISFQIIVLLAFQFLYGYMYYKVGLILTSFMIGIVLGSFSINRLLKNIKNPRTLYLKTQLFISIYPLILPLIFIYIARINLTNPDIGNTLQASFAFLPIIAGFMGGFQFPLANKICLKSSKDVGRTTGLLYGVDLLGSCIGGLFSSLLLIPILGIIQTCIFLSILNAFVMALLYMD